MKRLELDLEIEDIAEELLLSIGQLEALENSEHEKLPGSTYIIGYWRSYAALLEIDIAESIDKYKTSLKDPETSIVLEPNHQKAHGHQEKSRKKSAVLFFVLSAVFLAGIWYWQNPEENPISQWLANQASNPINALNSAQENETQVENQEQSAILFLDDDESVIALPEPNFAEDFQPSPEDEDIENTETLTETQVETSDIGVDPGANTEVVVNSLDDQNLPSTELSDETEQSEEQTNDAQQPETSTITLVSGTEAEQATDTQTSGVAEVNAETNTQNNEENVGETLIFAVNSQAWLDVRDGNGEKLIYRTAEEGEQIEITGLPPFSVFIGSGSGVEVEFKGEKIEYEPHSSGLFARFQVSGE